jgi:hypothetical protein
MNLWRLWMMTFVLGTSGAVLASDLLPAMTPTPAVPKPLVLSGQDKIADNTHYKLPKPPKKYNDGTPLKLINDEESAPLGAVMRNLGDPAAVQQVPSINQKDSHSNKYYWHPYNAWNYCHYRDGDRNWYGWRMGETFHWVLWKEGRFWWHDPTSERWIYFDRGYWWWQDSKTPRTFQVYLDDGHYHVSDSNGVLGDDLMKTGTEEVVTEPVAKPSPSPTPGGKHGGRHRRSQSMGASAQPE